MASKYNVLFSIALLATLAACANTRIDSAHPLLKSDAGGDVSTVYFLRPNTERHMGFPDNPVVLELNQEKLLDLGKGEYTVVHLVARDYDLALRNQTKVGPHWTVKEMVKHYAFEFMPGQTYFLEVTPVDGEFRGVFFTAQQVDLFKAKLLAEKLQAVSLKGSPKIPAL